MNLYEKPGIRVHILVLSPGNPLFQLLPLSVSVQSLCEIPV